MDREDEVKRVKYAAKVAVAAGVLAAVVMGQGRAHAQVVLRRGAAQKDMTVTVEMRREVIDGILKGLQERYVFPEVATKIEKSVRERAGRGAYDTITSAKELAEKLTGDVQEVSHDKHMRVLYSADPIPKFEGGGEPSPEEQERMRREARRANGAFVKVERLPGNVGYIEFRGFMDPEAAAAPLAAAMSFVADTDALIFDMRRNGGGSPAGVALVCSYLFEGKPIHLNSLHWRDGKTETIQKFWTRETVDGKRYVNKPVYVLTSGRTFSGAEEFTYNLKNLKRAMIVGETTGGGANPGGVERLNDHFAIFIPSGRAVSPITGTNWEGTGVSPDIAVPADKALETAHEHAVKKLLESAKDEDTRRMIQFEVERAKEEQARDKQASSK
jgi:retinol-binding protein 3